MATVTINGKDYAVNYTVRAMIETEKQVGKSLKSMADFNGFEFMAALAYCGIYESNPGVTLADFINSLGKLDSLNAALPALLEEFKNATGQDEDPKKEPTVSA